MGVGVEALVAAGVGVAAGRGEGVGAGVAVGSGVGIGEIVGVAVATAVGAFVGAAVGPDMGAGEGVGTRSELDAGLTSTASVGSAVATGKGPWPASLPWAGLTSSEKAGSTTTGALLGGGTASANGAGLGVGPTVFVWTRVGCGSCLEGGAWEALKVEVSASLIESSVNDNMAGVGIGEGIMGNNCGLFCRGSETNPASMTRVPELASEPDSFPVVSVSRQTRKARIASRVSRTQSKPTNDHLRAVMDGNVMSQPRQRNA